MELFLAKFITIERFTTGPRLGICAEASAEKFIPPTAGRLALGNAGIAAEAANAAEAAAMAEVDKLKEDSALSGASIAVICAEAAGPARRLIPAFCRVISEARNAASAASNPAGIGTGGRLAIALNEAAIVLTPDGAARFTPSAAERLAMVGSPGIAGALTAAEALAEAEVESAAVRAWAAPGASRLTPRVALTLDRTASSDASDGKPGTVGTGTAESPRELISIAMLAICAGALGAARFTPRFACVCAIAGPMAESCAIIAGLNPRLMAAEVDVDADAVAAAVAVTGAGPAIARLSCAMQGGAVMGGNVVVGNAFSIAIRFWRQEQLTLGDGLV